jgi:lipoprotein-releasing system ATP-binding protein
MKQIQAIHIHKSFQNELGHVDRKVLTDLNLEVEKSDCIALMGPSGSGKTTLLNILGTLDVPDQGDLLFDGQSVQAFKEKDLLEFRSRKIGFVFQFHHLLPQLNLLENVLLPTLTVGKSTRDDLDRAEQLLVDMNVWEQRFNKPGELSGGECQRAAVVRALMNRPEVILADEPTGSLDQVHADMLMDHFLKINEKEGVTFIIATHANRIADRMNRVLRLENGGITA